MLPSSWSVPVDRGWAWVIVIGAFMNAAILVGMFKCFGMFFAEILAIYHKSASGTATMLAISGGLSQFIGPLVMTFSDLYTCRVVSMIGGVFCCLGFLVPAYCTGVEQIIITFGIFTGLGYGMCLMPGTVIVSRYFERHRSLANGLVFSGAGVGGMVVPLFLNQIIELFGFQSALVILAGFALQTVVFASLYRPLTYWTQKGQVQPEAIEKSEPPEGLKQNHAATAMILERLHSVPEDTILENGYTNNPCETQDHFDLNFRTSLPILTTFEKQCCIQSRMKDDAFGSKDLGSNSTLYFSTLDLASWWPLERSPADDIGGEKAKNGKLADSDSCYQPKEQSKLKALFRRVCYAKAADGSEFPLLDFSLMKNRRFLLFVTASTFFMPIIYITMIIPPHCLELGMTKNQIALLLSIQGGADTGGRLFAGFLGDRTFIKSRRILLAIGLFATCSVATYASVFLTTFWGLGISLIISSLARGAYVAMLPVILVDLVGLSNFSRALGLNAFAQAFALTLTPVTIGALRDWTLSYTSGLIFCASCFAVSVSCFILIVVIDRRKLNISK